MEDGTREDYELLDRPSATMCARCLITAGRA
jgi:hypothetical protein